MTAASTARTAAPAEGPAPTADASAALDPGPLRRAGWSVAGRWLVALGLLGSLGSVAGCAGLFGPRRPRVEFTPYPESQVAAVRNPHAYLGRPLCQRCHLPGDAGLTSGAIALCVSCHAFGHANHPVDVVQATPARDLPLLPGGKVACHTCHDPHDLKRHRSGLRFGFSDLCLRCHTRHQQAPRG